MNNLMFDNSDVIVNQIIELGKKTINKLSENDMLKIIDTFSNLATPIKITILGIEYIRKVRFKSFLKYFYNSLIYNDISQEDILKIKNYLNNKKNLLFITESLETILSTNSILCSALLGYYSGLVLSDLEEVQQRDFIIISALKNINDYDLINFTKFYKHKKEFELSKNKKINYDIFKDDIFDLSLRKISSYNLINLDQGGFSGGIPGEDFRLNQISSFLYSIIYKSKIFEDIEFKDFVDNNSITPP